MGASVDLALDCARKGYELIKKSAKPLFIDLLKVNALGTVIGMAGLFITGMLLFVVAGDWLTAQLTQPSPPPADNVVYVALIISFVIFLASALLSRTATSLSYNVVENRSKGKKTMMMERFMMNLAPVVKLCLVIWLAMLVLASPLLLSFYFGEAALGALCILGPLCMVLLFVFGFLTQFAIFELVLGGKGAIDSIKGSFYLVRSNIWTVLLLDIFVGVVGFAAYAISKVAQLILQPLAMALSLTGLQGMLIGYAIYLFLLIVIGVFIAAGTDVITLPVLYNFWRRVKS